jgi:hypothetical protein
MKVKDLLSEKGKDYVYIMHLSYEGRERERLWNYAERREIIGLDHRDVNDDWNNVRESVEISRIWRKQFDMFCNEMKVGDLVLVLNGWDSLLGIAEVIEHRHQYDENLSSGIAERFFNHIRKVRWIRDYEYANRLRLSQPIEGFNNTLSQVKPNTQRWSTLINLNI